MPVKLLLHGWTLAEGPVVRLLSQHPRFLAAHGSTTCLPFARENDSSSQWGAVATVGDRR